MPTEPNSHTRDLCSERLTGEGIPNSINLARMVAVDPGPGGRPNDAEVRCAI